VPAEIAGIGSTQQKLRVSPGFDPLKAAVGPEEYFVLSRIDGSQTLRQVLLATGLSVERGISIVQRLRSIGALLLPGETAAPGPTAMPPLAADRKSGTIPPRTMTPIKPGPSAASSSSSMPAMGNRPAAPGRGAMGTESQPVVAEFTHDLTLPRATPEEQRALAEPNDLDDTERRRILAIARLADGRDPHALLGVAIGADARALKRAYFTLSKEIHPDRYYGQQLGSFGPRLAAAFESVSRAYAKLTSHDKKQAATQAAMVQVENRDQPQTPQSYAAELFERACQLEVQGDAMGAMKLFAAAVRVDAQLRYLRRAASCALAAGQPRSAVEYAKKAHGLSSNDPSAARLLAAAFRAAGKLTDAEEVLVMAMAMKSENDTLTAELRHDLAEVRRLLAH
jgi:tetratricopeptide (TPR) repeat protein